MQTQHPGLIIRPAFVLFGDSLTQRSFSPDQGWGAALASAYCRKVWMWHCPPLQPWCQATPLPDAG